MPDEPAPTPNVIEPATSGRAKCRGCGQRIPAKELRFGEKLDNPFADGDMTHWFHLQCAAYKRPEPFLQTLEAQDVPLEDRDSERLTAEARQGLEHRRLPRVNGAERSSTGRAKCRSCKEAIPKDAWRIPLVYYEEGLFSSSGFIHLACARAYFETSDLVPRIRHFSPDLGEGDLEEIGAALQAPSS